MKPIFITYTEKGRGHKNNKDSYVILDLKELSVDSPELSLICAVADGIGGGSDGDVASGILIKTVEEHISDSKINVDDIEESLTSIIMYAHKKILDYSILKRLDFIGTTAVIGLLDSKYFHFAWSGDSRAYIFRVSKLQMLSWDHTRLWERLKKGEITKEQAWADRDRATLSQSLGDDLSPPKPGYSKVKVMTDDIFILCSDGLTCELEDSSIEQIISNEFELQLLPEKLAQAALEAGSKDDITILLIKILD